RDGRFRRAADACAISQPALSMQIKELEQELGGELFERNAREVKLTAFGQTVALRIRDILRGVGKACVVVDMPFGSYQESKEVAFRNAVR
ncbi:LysR family transcriptional regulator, partial [Rhizobium ruizarguesonis]